MVWRREPWHAPAFVTVNITATLVFFFGIVVFVPQRKGAASWFLYRGYTQVSFVVVLVLIGGPTRPGNV